jgi:hypothetical protein
MTMNYVRIKAEAEDDAAHFRFMRNYEDSWELLEGMSLAETFPPNAAYRMNDDFPESLVLYGVLHNLDGVLVVNDALRGFLEEHGVREVEYLPVTVINHKDRAVEQAYYVVNILRHIDCIDQEQTQFEWDSLDDTLMDDVENLTIDESRIDPDIPLFRLKHLTSVMVIRRDLVEQMRDAGFKGFAVTELADFTW